MEVFPEWLPLTEYSTKYKVSVSTLRRKIKAEDINFRFEDGKYLILNCPPEAHPQHRPSQMSEVGAGVTGPRLDDSFSKASSMVSQNTPLGLSSQASAFGMSSNAVGGSNSSGASRSNYFGPSSTTLEIEQRIQKARADLQLQTQLQSTLQTRSQTSAGQTAVAPNVSVSAQLSQANLSTNAIATSSASSLDSAKSVSNSSEAKSKSDERKEDRQSDEAVLTAANRLLNELKKAYTQILHEREEQIMQLKEEAADLKTLIRVLESENDRLRGFKQ